MTEPPQAYDVVIIGLGPSGATLAHLLGQAGLDVLVLEREAAAYALPRAVHFDDEVMRVFQTLGLGEAVAATTLVNPGMRFVDADDRLLLDWSRDPGIGRHGWHASYRFHQPDLEAILSKGLDRYPKVTVRRRAEAFLIEDRGDDALVRYEDMRTGRILSATAAHVVGCDGARSLTRRFMATEMQDYGFHERWLVADFRLTAPRPDLGDHSVQFCHPERSVTYTRQPGDRRRWEVRLAPDDPQFEPGRPERVWPLVSRWIRPEEAEIERVAVYTFHSLVARQWRLGRLWLAGDAAHQSPPFMGQGMCAGIRDVSNLAWKLVLSVRGEADEAMLDSYESERRPNAERYIKTAVRLGGLINARDPDTALRMASTSADGVSRMESLVSDLGPGLGDGPHRGRLFGQPRLKDGRLMDDKLGYGPALLADAALVEGLGGLRPSGLVTTSEAPGLEDALARLGARAVLLRPDRYIFATANDLDELTSLLAAPALRGLLKTAPALTPA